MKSLPVLLICLAFAGGASATQMRPGSGPVRPHETRLACAISAGDVRNVGPTLRPPWIVATNPTATQLSGGAINYAVTTDAGVFQYVKPWPALAPGAAAVLGTAMRARSCIAWYVG